MSNRYALGLVSVSFRGHTPKEILEAMKANGLAVIEWGSDVHAPANDKEALLSIAALQAQYGITCSSYGTYFRLGVTPIEELEAYIAAAALLGTDVLRLWCGAKSGADMTGEEREALLAVCREAAAIAASHHVTLCMECHRKTFTERVEDALWLMAAVDSPHFKMYWQPFQWQTVAENIENAAKIAPHALHVHVSAKLPLGEAFADWRAYLQHFSTPRTLLLEFMPNDTLDELQTEAAALKNIIGEL